MAKKVHLLDYVAGNIRSLVNAIEKCGYEVEWIRSPEDVKDAEVRDDLRCAANAKKDPRAPQSDPVQSLRPILSGFFL